MKIGLIIEDITKKGGTERALIKLSEILLENGNDVVIISVSGKNQTPYYNIDKKVEILFLGEEKIEKLNKVGKVFYYFNFLKKVKSLVKNEKIECIISGRHAISILLPFIKVKHKIACEHVPYYLIPKISRIARIIAYRFLNKLIVLTETEKNIYERKNFKNIIVIPNALTFKGEKISDLKNNLLLAVGRFEKEKDFHSLLIIFEKIVKNNKNWKLKIIGEGSLERELKELTQNLKIEKNVIFEKWTKNIEDEYRESSIYLMTSKFEGLPLVLLEAMSVGVPVIAYDCPTGPREIIKNGNNGYLIKNNDEEEFIEKLQILMYDSNIRNKMGENAKEYSNNYNAESVAKKWRALFSEL